MSEYSASATRTAMQAKAARLVNQKDEKVDCSDWSPGEPMNTARKTGLQPTTRRAFKSGGKVEGESCAPNAGKSMRKGKASGGTLGSGKGNPNHDSQGKFSSSELNSAVNVGHTAMKSVQKTGSLSDHFEAKGKAFASAMKSNGLTADQARLAMANSDMNRSEYAAAHKHFNVLSRDKKASGGFTDPREAAAARISEAEGRANVPAATMQFTGIKKGALSPLRAAKDGGKIEHDDEAQDKKLIKKMINENERKERKSGGRAKGKTNINVIVMAGGEKKPPAAGMGAPPMDAGPGPLPPPMDMPPPPPNTGPAMPPPGPMPPPMPRRSGGRTIKMDHAAGGGLGRLEKIEKYGKPGD